MATREGHGSSSPVLLPDQKYHMNLSSSREKNRRKPIPLVTLPKMKRPTGFVKMRRRHLQSKKISNKTGSNFKGPASTSSYKKDTNLARNQQQNIKNSKQASQNDFSMREDKKEGSNQAFIVALTGYRSKDMMMNTLENEDKPKENYSQVPSQRPDLELVSEIERQIQDIIDTLRSSDFDVEQSSAEVIENLSCDKTPDNNVNYIEVVKTEQDFHESSFNDSISYHSWPFLTSDFLECTPRTEHVHRKSRSNRKCRRSGPETSLRLRSPCFGGSLPELERLSRTYDSLEEDLEELDSTDNSLEGALDLHETLEEWTNQLLGRPAGYKVRNPLFLTSAIAT